MLKIKDNIDLKELENFGYHELEKVYVKVIASYKGSGNAIIVKVSKTNRNITARSTRSYGYITNETTTIKYIVDLCDNNLIENQRKK